MQDIELTERLREIVDERITKEEIREDLIEGYNLKDHYKLYKKQVWRASEIGIDAKWSHNGYIFTTLGLCEVMRSLGFKRWEPEI